MVVFAVVVVAPEAMNNIIHGWIVGLDVEDGIIKRKGRGFAFEETANLRSDAIT